MYDIINRLRGRYPVGPILEDGEPEFGWRDFSANSTPLEQEAADIIEDLLEKLTIARGEALSEAANIGYVTCVKTRHGKLGDSVANNILGIRHATYLEVVNNLVDSVRDEAFGEAAMLCYQRASEYAAHLDADRAYVTEGMGDTIKEQIGRRKP